MIPATTPWGKEEVPDRVKAVMSALKRTQAQLAKVLGVSPITVNRWVNGHTVPDPRSQRMLSKLEETYVTTE